MNKKDWIYGDAIFKNDEVVSDWQSPWSGHKCFGYDLVVNLKPKLVVELGTARGTSFFSFAQAVIDNAGATKLVAIDTWEGDVHTGSYGSTVYSQVLKKSEELYPEADINLMRMRFDEAVDKFDAASIDILHIDGLHTYQAVKEDFETWFPKLKSDAIVLFHDISEMKDDFGVHQYWEELQDLYGTLEFRHSHGLGVLFLSNATYEDFKGLGNEWNIHYLRTVYQRTKGDLYQAKQALRELDEIKSSRFYRLKEQVKGLIGLS